VTGVNGRGWDWGEHEGCGIDSQLAYEKWRPEVNDEIAQRIVAAAEDRQTPYPSPESVVAKELMKFSEVKAGMRNKIAARITRALRGAGWRILRT
jgi:hypothetical protein